MEAKLKKYDAYKNSGVEWLGEIPESWEALSNKFIFKLKKIQVGKKSSEYDLLSLTLNGVIKRDMENPQGKFPAEFDTYQEVKMGDFIFCLFDVEETPRTVGLSKEWADHIGISNDRITFFHSKFKTANASASAFQDIVGQAQKNLGNLTPQDFQLETKRNIWDTDYNSADGTNTVIHRIRKGPNANAVIHQFKETIKNPYLKKEVYLVINFISKTALETYLDDLVNGVYFVERNEAIQILWFISSLISSCQELNTEVTIFCKP